MTLWIDAPLWPAHGRLFAHLVSDRSLEELHVFARRVGLHPRAYDGDHYDVPQERHADVVAAGATAIDGHELVRRLAASGLRYRKRKGDRPLTRIPDGLRCPAEGGPAVPAGCARAGVGDPACRVCVPGPHVLDLLASPQAPPSATTVAVLALVLDEGRVLVARDGDLPGGPVTAADDHAEVLARAVRAAGLGVAARDLVPVGYARVHQ